MLQRGPRLLDAEGLARLFGVCVGTVKRWKRLGFIEPTAMRGRTPLYNVAAAKRAMRPPKSKPKPPRRRRGRRRPYPRLTTVERHEEGCRIDAGEPCSCIGGPQYQLMRNGNLAAHAGPGFTP